MFASAPRRILLDTHVWLWWQGDNRRLGRKARKLIEHALEVRFSAASAWEIAIKTALGKLKLPRDADIEQELSACGFLALPVEIAHAELVRSLPAIHADPFDRLLIAQARVEGLAVVTCDPQFSSYGIPTIDASL